MAGGLGVVHNISARATLSQLQCFPQLPSETPVRNIFTALPVYLILNVESVHLDEDEKLCTLPAAAAVGRAEQLLHSSFSEFYFKVFLLLINS